MKVALIYVNPVEYHGPHLPLKTDYEISRGLASRWLPRLKEQNPEFEIVHTTEIHRGCDPAPGPGSEFTSLKELKKIVVDTSREVAAQFKPDLVLYMTFHGAPKHAAAIEAGIQDLKARGVRGYNPFNHILQIMRDYDPHFARPAAHFIADPSFRTRFVDTLSQDFHGGLFETSTLLALNAPLVDPSHRTLPDCNDRTISLPWKIAIALTRTLGFNAFSRELHIGADTLGWLNDHEYRGYTGSPRFANEQIGNYFIENVILKTYEENFWNVANGSQKSPRPIMQWSTRIP